VTINVCKIAILLLILDFLSLEYIAEHCNSYRKWNFGKSQKSGNSQ